MKTQNLKTFPAALLISALMTSIPAFAAGLALPAEPRAQSAETKAVQPDVDTKANDKAAEKRKEIIEDAVAAVDETRKALKLIDV